MRIGEKHGENQARDVVRAAKWLADRAARKEVERTTRAEFQKKARAWFFRPRIIDRRVDWFELRFRVALDRAFVRYLKARHATAKRQGGKVPFRWTGGTLAWRPYMRPPTAAERRRPGFDEGLVTHEAGDAILVGELHASMRPGCYVISNGEYGITIDRNAVELSDDGEKRPGFNVQIQWRAAALAVRGADAMLSRLIAGECGTVLGGEVARLDLAVTLAGWKVADDDRNRIVVRSRSKVQRYTNAPRPRGRPKKARPTDIAPPLTVYGLRECTGFMVSPGNDVVARNYDKLREMLDKGEIRWSRDGARLEAMKAKGEIELTTWRARGAFPERESIARVEFQLRAAALDELGLRDPRTLTSKLDAAWRYLVGTDAREVNALRDALKRAIARRKRKSAAEEEIEELDAKIAGTRKEIARRRRAGEAHPGWMRMIRPNGARRKRAPLDVRWATLQRATFTGSGRGVAIRRRAPRQGASVKQAIGSALSALAAADELHPVVLSTRQNPETGAFEKCDERETVERWSEFRQRNFVHVYLERAFHRMARLAADVLIAEKGEKSAAEFVALRINGSIARHETLRFDSAMAARADRLKNGPYPGWNADHKKRFVEEKAMAAREADAVAWSKAVIRVA